jgi:hypothetical protein
MRAATLSVMATVRQRRLGRTLRQTRETLGLKPDYVASELKWDRSKVSRIETARSSARQADVALLLDLYGITSPERDALLALAADASRRGWWTAYSDVFTGSFVELEAGASSIREWHTTVIPGLLQIEDYARAIISDGRPDDPTEDIERRVQARMVRRTLIGREGAPHLHAVLDESVLRRQIGGRAVMRRQLSYLWDAAQRPNITVQIMPYTAGAHEGVNGSFIILRYDDPADPDVPFSEGQFGDIYPESEQETARINLSWDRIARAALSPQQSAEVITALINEE